MKLLITGAAGQLGRSVRRAFADHDVVALSHAELDISDLAAVTMIIGGAAPDVVIHCAALTDTNRCEKEPALARLVNGIGSENVAKACHAAGARLVAISTNEVFSGTKREPYVETDATGPLNAYALSKLDGEFLAASACPDTLIVRVSWLYGDGYVNFVEKVIAAAKEGRKLAFVTDEIATPTSTEDVGAALKALLEKKAAPGIYHLVNEGEASRYDWATEIFRLAFQGKTLVLLPKNATDDDFQAFADALNSQRDDYERLSKVEPTTTAELRAGGYAGPEKPQYSVLANTRAAALVVTMPPWRDALAAYFERARTATDA